MFFFSKLASLLTPIFRTNVTKPSFAEMISKGSAGAASLLAVEKRDVILDQIRLGDPLHCDSLIEVIGKIEDMHRDDLYLLWSGLMMVLEEDSSTDPEILNAINRALDCLQVQDLFQAMQDGTESHSSNFVNQQTYDKSMKLLTKLTGALNTMKELEGAHPMKIYQYFRAIMGILAVFADSRDKYREHCRHAYHSIVSFGNCHEHTFINSFLKSTTLCSKQSFSVCEEEASPLVNYSKQLFRDFTTINDENIIKEPWHLVSRFVETNKKTSNDSKKMSHHMSVSYFERFDRWFLNLIALERMILDPSTDIFSHFIEGLESNFVNIQREMDLQNVHLIFGLTEFLSKVLHFPETKEETFKAKVISSSLLKMMSFNNQKADQGLPFNIADACMREDLNKAIGLIMGQSHGNRLKSRCSVSFLKR